ncbi:MAG: FapA family protein [Candidatus Auribacterota bacterium]
MEHLDQRLNTTSSQKETKFVIKVSHDKMQAVLSVYPKNGEPITVSPLELKDKLVDFGVVHGIKFPMLSEISRKLAESGDNLENIRVAVGTPPKDGKDGRIEMLVNTVVQSVGKQKEDGSIDYKQKETIIKVQKGQMIARHHDPTLGEDGILVDGNPVKSKHGKKLNIQIDNIDFDEEKKVYISNIDGRLMYRKNYLAVLGVRQIEGDVNFETGCVDFPGTVAVTGSVIPDFYVKARGDIYIGENITDATIECGGTLKVKCGIVGSHKSVVKCGGSILVSYVQNSTVYSEESIMVKKSVYGSKLIACDRIQVDDTIVGGVTSAGKEIMVKDVGSPTGTETFLEAGVQPELKQRVQEISQKIQFCEQNIEKIQNSLGEGICNMPEEFLDVLYQNQPAELRKIIDMYKQLKQQKKDLIAERNAALESAISSEPAFIKVRGTIYPGSKISIKGKKMVIEEEMKYTKFYLDEKVRLIQWVSL